MQHNRLLYLLSVTGGNSTHIEVDLYYNKGGMNYFTGKFEDRGLYISVKPINKSDNSVIYTAFSGVKRQIRRMGRFDKRVLDNFNVNEWDWDIYCLIEHVLEKHGNKIKLTEDSRKKFNEYKFL